MNRIITIFLLMIGLISGINCDSRQDNTTPQVGPVKAPDFTLKDIASGQEVKLSALIGSRPVILDFWASWCPPCRDLMPKLNEYYQSNKDKIIVIGISGDNSIEAARSFVAKNNIAFTIVYDDTKNVFGAYQIGGIPTTIVINTKGEIVKQGHFSIEELKEIVKSLK